MDHRPLRRQCGAAPERRGQGHDRHLRASRGRALQVRDRGVPPRPPGPRPRQGRAEAALQGARRAARRLLPEGPGRQVRPARG